MPAPPTFYHTQQFYFFAYAGTADRVRPDDMAISGYYFGIRYKCPKDGYWYYKTTAHTLNWRQSETLAQPINIDVEYASPTTFVDAPFGIGTVYYELVVCSSAQTTWSTSVPGTVIKLPDVTINGVHYINSGSFTINDWITTSPKSMNFNSATGWTSSNYISTIINTSLTGTNYWTWTKDSWINGGVYRSGSIVSAGAYMDGDELRIWPSNNGGVNRMGNVTVSIASSAKYIDVYQNGSAPGYSFSFAPDAGITLDGASYGVLTTGGTDQFFSFKATSGFGTSYVNVWVRLYDNTANSPAIGVGWILLPTHNGTSKDGIWNNCHVTTANTFVVNGHTYSLEITLTNPNQ